MALSDTARRILTEAAQHPMRLASPPDKLLTAAARAVLNIVLKQGYVEECEAPREYVGLGWRRQDGAWAMIRATEAGLLAIGAAPASVDLAASATLTDTKNADTGPERANAPQDPGNALLTASAAEEPHEDPSGANAVQQPFTAPIRPSLRYVARRVLAAWDDEAGERAGLADAMAALRAILVKPAPAPRTTSLRKLREGTKQQEVLGMLRRPEGATVAQIAEATGWQPHTVLGFFAGLKKRQGIKVSVLERVRQVGPGKEGAKGSYTVY
jgi:hypothetical protein